MKRLEHLRVGARALLALLVFLGLPQAARAAELPADSVYQLDAPLETHRGKRTSFTVLAGEPRIVSMFYGSCPHVCPMLISTIRQVESRLAPEDRDALRVALISVDPVRDDPASLRALAQRHGVDNESWMFARSSEHDTRALAAVLGIKYKQLPDGEFNHTSAMILLDAQGREIARSGKLGVPDPAFVDAVRHALGGD